VATNRDDEDYFDDDSLFSGNLGPLNTDWRLRVEQAPDDSTPLSGTLYNLFTDSDPRAGFPNTHHPAVLPDERDQIESMRTSPLPDHLVGADSGLSALFDDRYSQRETQGMGQMAGFAEQRQQFGPFAPPTATPQPPVGESAPMFARRQADRHFNPALQQRRAEDERHTGRRWPGNGLAYAGSAHEAMYFDQLAISLGEVDPILLARESAMRYVRAARIPGDDELGPTDIYSIFYYGLGLTLRPLDCRGLPHVLGVYNRGLHEMYLDWTQLVDPPQGKAIFDQTAWRRAVDASPLARFLIAWSVAVHLTDNYDIPLVLGFAPYLPPAPGGQMPSAPTPPPDTMNRYRKAMLATATLLAPAERLWQQIAALRLGVHMGDPEWRARMRAEYGGPSGRRPTGAPGFGNGVDPAEQLVAVLAERNACPPLLIETQLDDSIHQLDWGMWSLQLVRQIPALQMRFPAAARMFHTSGAFGGQGWNGAMRPPEIQPVHIQLSL